MASQELREVIQDLEDQTWRALSTSGEKLLVYLASDCIFLFPLGMKITHNSNPDLTTVMTSEAFLPWKSYEMRDVEVTPVGYDGAVITYDAIAARPGVEGRDEPFRALISTTWRKEEKSGKWLMCVHQQTPYDEDLEL